MKYLFIKCFSGSFFVLCKLHLLIQRRAVLKVKIEMGWRSRVFIRDHCNQDFIENKENIKEFAMVKDKNKSLKNNVTVKGLQNSKKNKNIEERKQKTVESIEEEKVVESSNKALKKQVILNSPGESTNVSKNKKTAKSMVSHDSTHNTKRELREQHSSEIKKYQFDYTSHVSPIAKNPVVVLHRTAHPVAKNPVVVLHRTAHPIAKDPVVVLCRTTFPIAKDPVVLHRITPPIAKHPVVVLHRIPYFDEDTISSSTASFVISDDGSDVTLKDAVEAESNDCKSKNDLAKCRCHSDLLLKEAVIVLEKLDNFQENSIALLKEDEKIKEVPNKSGKGTKRKKEKSKNEDKNSSEATKSKKQKVSNESKSSKKEKIPDVTALDFSNDSKSVSGNSWNFKISSWNINGIRAWLEKNGLSYLHHEQPDILCIQETKCSDDKLPDEVKQIEGYHTYWLSGDKDGYSGVGLITKEKPIKVEYGIGISEHDNEGRVITAEYEKFYLVSTYVPNAGRGLVRLDYRMKWDKDFREYLKKLDADKPIILTGDLNVAHEEIDLTNPKTNKKNAGFTKEEREGFSTLLKEGFIDTFRQLYPNLTGAYTFWTYMMNARAKNVGWRLDYFVLSERFTESLCDNVIRKDVYGSDHCPITLFLSL